jgi:hypothetical protein
MIKYMNQKGFSPIIFLVIVVVLSGLVGVYYLGTQQGKLQATNHLASRPSPMSQNSNSAEQKDTSSKCKYDGITGGQEFLESYEVKEGDTLLSIAKNTLKDVSRADELAKINNNNYPNLSTSNPFLEVGWVLNLPPNGSKRTNGLLFAENGRLSISQNGWGTGYPQESQRYKIEELETALKGQEIKEGECVTIIFEGSDLAGSNSGIRAVTIYRQI